VRGIPRDLLHRRGDWSAWRTALAAPGRFLRASGDAVRNHFARSGGRHGDLSHDFPGDLLRANRRGALQGWFAYPVARAHGPAAPRSCRPRASFRGEGDFVL
jgi:hypothetical protein